MIGKNVRVIIDRPLGSTHPKFPETVYELNYGYVPGIMGGDGEEQDAYVLGVPYAISEFYGKVIAIVHRRDDVEEKWIVAPLDMDFSDDEILAKIDFQEKYFDVTLEK